MEAIEMTNAKPEDVGKDHERDANAPEDGAEATDGEQTLHIAEATPVNDEDESEDENEDGSMRQMEMKRNSVRNVAAVREPLYRARRNGEM